MLSDQCANCKNYLGYYLCEAFREEEIPDEIYVGTFDHVKPYPGDHGIRFKQIKEKAG